jgi:hypothetical protein
MTDLDQQIRQRLTYLAEDGNDPSGCYTDAITAVLDILLMGVGHNPIPKAVAHGYNLALDHVRRAIADELGIGAGPVKQDTPVLPSSVAADSPTRPSAGSDANHTPESPTGPTRPDQCTETIGITPHVTARCTHTTGHTGSTHLDPTPRSELADAIATWEAKIKSGDTP